MLNEGDRFRMLVGWEFGEYFWEAILDAGAQLRDRAGLARAVALRERVAVLMLGLLRKHRYFRSHDLESSYDVVIIGAGAHGMATRLLPGQAPRHEAVAVLDKSYIGAGGVGPQHHHHPLQLPDRRGRRASTRRA